LIRTRSSTLKPTHLQKTGSGKTFTITGGPARYEDRGLLPRALAMVFEEMRQGAGDVQYQVMIKAKECVLPRPLP